MELSKVVASLALVLAALLAVGYVHSEPYLASDSVVAPRPTF